MGTTDLQILHVQYSLVDDFEIELFKNQTIL